MYYAKWMEELAKQDTKLLRALRYRSYWYLAEMAGIFALWDREYYFWNLMYIGIVVSTQLCGTPTVFYTMFCVEDVAEKGQYFNFFSLLIISLSVIITSHHVRKVFLMLFTIEAEEYYHYDIPLNLKELDTLKKVFFYMKKALLVALPGYFLMAALAFLFSDYLDASFGYNTTITEDYVNDVYQHLPVKAAFYFTIDTNFKWFICVSIEVGCFASVGVCFTWCSVFFTNTGQKLIVQMKTLVIAIRETDARADQHYTIKTGKKPPSDSILRRKDPEMMTSYRACIKQTMEHHKVILYVFQAFQDICNWPTCFIVMNGAVLMAMSVVTLMKGGGKPSLTVTSSMLIGAEAVLLTVMCEFGQWLKNLGEEIFCAMHEFRWMDCTKDVTRDVRFMMTKMSEPLILFGVLTPLNRETLATMINSAYSYINLVRGFDERRKSEKI